MEQAYSLNVSNSFGGSNRAPILVAREYHHWSQRLERYLTILGRDVWRSVEEGPHGSILTPIAADRVQARLGGGPAAKNGPTNDNPE